MAQRHVQIVLDDDRIPAGLDGALRRIGACASFRTISEVIRGGVKSATDAVVVVTPESDSRHDRHLGELFDRMSQLPRPMLILDSQQTGGGARPAHDPALPVTYGYGLGEDELAVRLSTMIDMRPSLESARSVRRNGDAAAERLASEYRQQLEVASRLQRELLAMRTPQCDGLSFATLYKPAESVSGDMYDIRKLSDDLLCVALMDVAGHDFSAGLMTLFVKRALRGLTQQREDGSWPSPDQVLSRLNEEIIETELSECHFVAAVVAMVDLRTRLVQIARGGAPYPLLRTADGKLTPRRPFGSIVGVLPEATFDVVSFRLNPGDGLVLYSDGVDQLFSQVACDPRMTGRRSDLPILDRAVTVTPWPEVLRTRGVGPALEHLDQRHATLRRLGHALDDLTVVAIMAE